MRLANVLSVGISGDQYTINYNGQILYQSGDLMFCLRLVGAKLPRDKAVNAAELKPQDKATLDIIFDEASEQSIVHDVVLLQHEGFTSLCINEEYKDGIFWHGNAINPNSRDMVFYKGATLEEAQQELAQGVADMKNWNQD